MFFLLFFTYCYFINCSSFTHCYGHFESAPLSRASMKQISLSALPLLWFEVRTMIWKRILAASQGGWFFRYPNIFWIYLAMDCFPICWFPKGISLLYMVSQYFSEFWLGKRQVHVGRQHGFENRVSPQKLNGVSSFWSTPIYLQQCWGRLHLWANPHQATINPNLGAWASVDLLEWYLPKYRFRI